MNKITKTFLLTGVTTSIFALSLTLMINKDPHLNSNKQFELQKQQDYIDFDAETMYSIEKLKSNDYLKNYLNTNGYDANTVISELLKEYHNGVVLINECNNADCLQTQVLQANERINIVLSKYDLEYNCLRDKIYPK